MATAATRAKVKYNEQHYKKFTLQLDKELIEKWEEKLKEDNVPKAEFVRNAIKAYLEK